VSVTIRRNHMGESSFLYMKIVVGLFRLFG